MHTIHYARKISLPDYPVVTTGTGNRGNLNNRSGRTASSLSKLLPLIVAGCVLGMVLISAHQAPVSGKDELALLQSMASSDENAQLQLGLAYRDGRLGLKPDAQQAGYWLNRAAAGGNLYAKQLLSEKPQSSSIDSFGSEVSRLLPLQNDISHLRALAESGDNRAQFELAMRYRDGSWGVERSPALSREWLEKSAAAGNLLARQELNTISGQSL